MARDYARTRESRKRGRPANNTGAKSNFTWLILGIVMGLIIAGLSFLKHRVVSTVHPEKKYVVEEHPKDKAHKPKPILPKDDTVEEKVNFDFYTILPNMKVKGSKDGQTVNTLKPAPEASKLDKTIANSAPHVTPKALQNVEQNLLSPSNAVKVESNPLKPVAPTASTAKPAHTDKTEAVHVDKKPAEKQENSHKVPVHEAAKPVTHPHEKTAAPVVDLTAPKASHESKVVPKTPVVTSAYIVQIAAFKRFEDADRLKAQLTLAGFEAKVKVVPVNGVNWNRVWLGPYPTAQAAEKVQKELAAKHTKSVIVKLK